MTAPHPLAGWPVSSRMAIAGVLSDIDDTLTTDGRLESGVLSAIEQLRAAGLLFIPITGRPAGWCDMIARALPVDAVVGENGAFYFRYDAAGRRMVRRYLSDEAEQAENRRRLEAIRDEVLAEVADARVAADQPYRWADLAIDFAEDTGPLDDDDIDRIVKIFHRHGAQAKVSSIHVNGWFGDYDKLAATRLLMVEQFDTKLDEEESQFVFIGDSPNDAPMFGFFSNSIGVANLTPFLGRCDALPKWITREDRGGGFVEMAEALLSVR